MSTTTQPAAEREHRPYDIEILAPGTFAGVTVSEADLQHVADNFAKLKGLHDVPVEVRLGHSDEQVLAQDDGGPSFGWAERVYKKGSGAAARLMATIVGMPRALREAINSRAYRKVSAGLYPAWQSTEAERNLRTGVTGLTLQHIAFLGASIPRIRQLADLPRVLAAGERDDEAAVLLCLSDPPAEGLRAAAPLSDGALSVVHKTLTERLAQAERGLNTMTRRRRAAEVILSTYQPTKFTSYDAAAGAGPPDDVGSMAQALNDEIDGRLQELGLSLDDVAARRRVCKDILVQWRGRDNPYGPGSMAEAIDPKDVERCISGAARNLTPARTVQPRQYAEGALPSVDANSDLETQLRTALERTMSRMGWPIDDIQKRREAARIILSEWQRLGADPRYGSGDNLASQVTDDLYSRVIMNYSPAAKPSTFEKESGVAQASERGFAQFTEAKRCADAPLYGSAAMRASELGSEAAYRRLLVLASENGLRLGRTEDRKRAEALLCKEMGNAGDVVTFGEGGSTGEPPAYGSRGMVAPTPGARELAFTENVAARLRTMDALDPYRVAKAYKAEAAMHPQLTPDYGRNTRARRARG